MGKPPAITRPIVRVDRHGGVADLQFEHNTRGHAERPESRRQIDEQVVIERISTYVQATASAEYGAYAYVFWSVVYTIKLKTDVGCVYAASITRRSKFEDHMVNGLFTILSRRKHVSEGRESDTNIA